MSDDEFIQLEEVEKLILENFQIKFDLIESTKRNLKYKEEELRRKRDVFVLQLQQKYAIDIEKYDIDLVLGVCKRRDGK